MSLNEAEVSYKRCIETIDGYITSHDNINESPNIRLTTIKINYSLVLKTNCRN